MGDCRAQRGALHEPGGPSAAGTSGLADFGTGGRKPFGGARHRSAHGLFRTAPIALPVNYLVIDGGMVLRTGAETSASFEVDRIGDASREGWSVLLTGRAGPVYHPERYEQQLVRRRSPGGRQPSFRAPPHPDGIGPGGASSRSDGPV